MFVGLEKGRSMKEVGDGFEGGEEYCTDCTIVHRGTLGIWELENLRTRERSLRGNGGRWGVKDW